MLIRFKGVRILSVCDWVLKRHFGQFLPRSVARYKSFWESQAILPIQILNVIWRISIINAFISSAQGHLCDMSGSHIFGNIDRFDRRCSFVSTYRKKSKVSSGVRFVRIITMTQTRSSPLKERSSHECHSIFALIDCTLLTRRCYYSLKVFFKFLSSSNRVLDISHSQIYVFLLSEIDRTFGRLKGMRDFNVLICSVSRTTVPSIRMFRSFFISSQPIITK
jgi:hypothetical protein